MLLAIAVLYTSLQLMSNMTPFLKMDESRRKPNNTTTVKECDSSIDISEFTRFYTDEDIMNRRAKSLQNMIRNYCREQSDGIYFQDH